MAKLKKILPKNSGRGAKGQITVNHRGGRQKRFYRDIDFKRDKRDVWGKVEQIEYDPNRNCNIALVLYKDGERRYILAPAGIEEGSKIIASEVAPIEPGNALPLSKIPAGTDVHNLEIRPGKGGQMVKSAGSVATVQSKEDGFVLVKLPSGEIRRFQENSLATIGQVGNAAIGKKRVRKAGTNRRKGKRPTVRGVAKHPAAHPHGGGEGKSGVGLKYPKTSHGKPAVGKTRKKKKYSDRLIVKGRKRGPHASEKKK